MELSNEVSEETVIDLFNYYIAKNNMFLITKEQHDKYINLPNENEKLKKGIYKILKLNEYMIHCESKEVIYKFLMKQWRTIYETLGIPEPGLARCSKNNFKKENKNETI